MGQVPLYALTSFDPTVGLCLGGGRFLMGEVPLHALTPHLVSRASRSLIPCHLGRNHELIAPPPAIGRRVTSLARKRTPIGPYHRPCAPTDGLS